MAQTLKFGKGTWATKTGSSMAYNDQNGNYKPLPFNVERDSIATRVNKEGLIEVVGKDKLRIDYTDSAKGVALLENSSTNLVTYSEDFSQSYWTKEKTSITSNVVISPDGTLNASKLVEDSSNGLHRTYSNLITTSQNNNYTSTVFAKKGGRDIFGIQTSSSAQPFVWFNLDKGIIELQESGIVGKIESLPNGWYKCSATWNSSSATNDRVFIQLAQSISNTSYTGDGTSGVYIWGAMFEQNSIASSYIPTSGSTYQRQADVANGSGNSEVFNDSEGVLFVNIAANSKGGGYKLISLTDSTSGNSFISIGMMNNTTESYKQIRFSGVNLFPDFTDPINQTDFNKIAIKYKSGNSSFYVNGFEIDSSSVTYTPNAALSELKFSYFQDGDDFYGNTKELCYYDATLTDSELEYLTSYRSLNELVTELNLNTL